MKQEHVLELISLMNGHIRTIKLELFRSQCERVKIEKEGSGFYF